MGMFPHAHFVLRSHIEMEVKEGTTGCHEAAGTGMIRAWIVPSDDEQHRRPRADLVRKVCFFMGK